MPECLNPRLAYQTYEGEKPHFLTSRDYIECQKNTTYLTGAKLLLLPCKKCPNCMANISMDWTSRLVKEAEEWKYCYFATFTYDDTHLFYKVGGLNVRRNVLDSKTHKQLKRDIQLFLKRFRDDTGFKLKYYFACESGETTSRTHWHCILFMESMLDDLVFYGNNLYTSQTLQRAWKNGLITVSSDVNQRSIKYTIGYTLKKLGEYKLQLMSKGLGLRYLEDKKEDIKFSKGFYLNNGFLVNPPSYFIRKMKESSNPEDIKWVEEYENRERGSIKVTQTLDDLFLKLVTLPQTKKGKGAF